MRTTVTIIGGTPGKTARTAGMGTNTANDTATPKESQRTRTARWLEMAARPSRPRLKLAARWF